MGNFNNIKRRQRCSPHPNITLHGTALCAILAQSHQIYLVVFIGYYHAYCWEPLVVRYHRSVSQLFKSKLEHIQ